MTGEILFDGTYISTSVYGHILATAALLGNDPDELPRPDDDDTRVSGEVFVEHT